VRCRSAAAQRGTLSVGLFRVPCALGYSGIRADKREGDGATPRGRFALRRVLYNPSRGPRPQTRLPVGRIARDDGWCDAPRDRNYNRAVRHPYPASAERLWRKDCLYDLIVVLGHNDWPRVRGRGSAVFLHIAHDDFRPTQGCIAVRAPDLRRIIARLSRRAQVVIGR
jgi:L,D-peptidoglycan transpeptidase YkuD (ErfK/YbiS/YcfS/YnhG family)